ncbi:MAG: hypothetical protein ACI8Z5_001866 [Lentimonas sp.]|jgi:uncharacterized protein (DUF1778 family)
MTTIATSLISIDATPEQHKRLKATTALSGKSLKQYLLEKALPNESDAAALRELENFLKPRIQTAMSGEFVNESVEEIFNEID